MLYQNSCVNVVDYFDLVIGGGLEHLSPAVLGWVMEETGGSGLFARRALALSIGRKYEQS